MTVPLQIVRHFFNSLIAGDQSDLTNRQMSIFLTIYDTDREYTIKTLTAELGLTKPTVSRAVDKLAEMNFLAKREYPKDRRSIIVSQTFTGHTFMAQIQKYLADANTKYYESLFRNVPSKLGQKITFEKS